MLVFGTCRSSYIDAISSKNEKARFACLRKQENASTNPATSNLQNNSINLSRIQTLRVFRQVYGGPCNMPLQISIKCMFLIFPPLVVVVSAANLAPLGLRMSLYTVLKWTILYPQQILLLAIYSPSLLQHFSHHHHLQLHLLVIFGSGTDALYFLYKTIPVCEGSHGPITLSVVYRHTHVASRVAID